MLSLYKHFEGENITQAHLYKVNTQKKILLVCIIYSKITLAKLSSFFFAFDYAMF
jgi:hypothetical protein